MLGSLILYLEGMRRMMFQLSGFYFIGFGVYCNTKVQHGSAVSHYHDPFVLQKFCLLIIIGCLKGTVTI